MRKLLSSRPFLPFWTSACSPDPFPPLLYLLVVHLGWHSPHSAYTHTFLHLTGPTVSVLYSQQTNCCYCANSPLSLLCNLISSSWVPVIANSNGKRKIPQNHNDHKRNNKSIIIEDEGEGEGGNTKSISFCHLRSTWNLIFVCYIKTFSDNKPFLCAKNSSQCCTCWTHLNLNHNAKRQVLWVTKPCVPTKLPRVKVDFPGDAWLVKAAWGLTQIAWL